MEAFQSIQIIWAEAETIGLSRKEPGRSRLLTVSTPQGTLCMCMCKRKRHRERVERERQRQKDREIDCELNQSLPFITMLIETAKTAAWPDHWWGKTIEKQEVTQDANTSFLQCNKWIHPFAKCQVNISLGTSCVPPRLPPWWAWPPGSLSLGSCLAEPWELRRGRVAGTGIMNTPSPALEGTAFVWGDVPWQPRARAADRARAVLTEVLPGLFTGRGEAGK